MYTVEVLNPHVMDTQENQTIKVGLDQEIVKGLDRWRDDCPTINRTALVNQIILEWLREKKVQEMRLRQSHR